MRLLMSLVLALGFAAATYAEEVTLKITGMSCPSGCVGKVNGALSKVNGVTAKEVKLGSAKVTYDAKKTSKEAIIKAVEKTGFKVAKK